MLRQGIQRRRKKRREAAKNRSAEQKAVIAEAKALLMERNHMSEEEAHRYLQKSSMDSGTNMLETAQMVLTIMRDTV
jgi:response regulator NasT